MTSARAARGARGGRRRQQRQQVGRDAYSSWTSESDVVGVTILGRLPAKRKSLTGLAIVCVCLVCGCGGGGGGGGSNPAPVNPPPPQEPVDVVRFSRSTETGLARQFSLDIGRAKEVRKLSGGVAAGDYDGDGDTDLVVVGGDADTNRLFRNRGDGTFDDVFRICRRRLCPLGQRGRRFGDIDGGRGTSTCSSAPSRAILTICLRIRTACSSTEHRTPALT